MSSLLRRSHFLLYSCESSVVLPTESNLRWSVFSYNLSCAHSIIGVPEGPRRLRLLKTFGLDTFLRLNADLTVGRSRKTVSPFNRLNQCFLKPILQDLSHWSNPVQHRRRHSRRVLCCEPDGATVGFKPCSLLYFSPFHFRYWPPIQKLYKSAIRSVASQLDAHLFSI